MATIAYMSYVFDVRGGAPELVVYDPQPTALRLAVTSGTGTGPNPLAAFDAALFAAGIANFNLIYLSSVIPAGSTVIDEKPQLAEHGWGHRLYVVMAQKRVEVLRERAWAGVGWVQNEEDQRGLFVEHTGSSEDEVASLIHDSLASMTSYRPGTFGKVHMRAAGAECEGQPTCALVAVVYGSEPWGVRPLLKPES